MLANPADYFMKVLSVNYPKTSDDEKHIACLTSNYDTLLAPKFKDAY